MQRAKCSWLCFLIFIKASHADYCELAEKAGKVAVMCTASLQEDQQHKRMQNETSFAQLSTNVIWEYKWKK